MNLILGFESQVDARGAVPALVRAAADTGASVTGVALARRDSSRGMHVDSVRAFGLPSHVLSMIDGVMEEERDTPLLRGGQTALVVSLTVPERAAGDREALTERAWLTGALWVRALGEI
jgi:hypothetical protein